MSLRLIREDVETICLIRPLTIRYQKKESCILVMEGRLPLVDPMYIKALRFGGYLMISAGPMFEGFVESSSTVGRPHGACQHEHAVNDK